MKDLSWKVVENRIDNVRRKKTSEKTVGMGEG